MISLMLMVYNTIHRTVCRSRTVVPHIEFSDAYWKRGDENLID